jgi:pSer/pThr/pTyr-binding forkhead associated (FHA) protein
MANSCLLLAPPRPPLVLAGGSETVLGRSPDCTLTVPSPRASRRHAVVRREGDRVLLRDLASTNGTWLNGDPVTLERELRSGDRIEIGDTIVTYCCLEADRMADSAAGDSAQTMLSLRTSPPAPAPDALRGDLAQIPLFAVLQMLEMGGQSGRLDVSHGERPGRIWLSGGQVVHAETEKEQGLPAALSIAGGECGRFEFASGETAEAESFAASVTEVILEATRLLDEARG